MQQLVKMKFNSGTPQMLRAYLELNSSNQIFSLLLLMRKAGAILVMKMDSFMFGVLNVRQLRLLKFQRHK